MIEIVRYLNWVEKIAQKWDYSEKNKERDYKKVVVDDDTVFAHLSKNERAKVVGPII